MEWRGLPSMRPHGPSKPPEHGLRAWEPCRMQTESISGCWSVPQNLHDVPQAATKSLELSTQADQKSCIRLPVW